MKRTLLTLTALVITSIAFAGDGTKENPYTVSELNAQKDALAASGNTVWVKADLKGLGEDGKETDNADTEDSEGKTVHHLAGLFGDETGEFVAYSWQILGQLAPSDLTNTKNLLIALTYGTSGHPYGNSTNPQYASNDYEPADAHFSLGEVHGALTLEIKGGYRGYHIPACYLIPKDIVAARVSSNYTQKNGASVNYGYYDGAEEGKEYVINKNTALVLLANDGTYDFVLSSALYEQINSNSLNGGTAAGANTIKNANRWHFRFIHEGDKLGFERNGSTDNEVILNSKDEIYLTVNSNQNHFGGNWSWETDDKKWISWQGKSISDFHGSSNINKVNINADNKKVIYDLQGQQLNEIKRGVNIINGKKYIKK